MTDHQLPKAKKSGAGAIFITGAGSGIGAATARLFAKNGWSVGLADHQARSVEALAAELGTHAHWYEVDVLDRSALDASMAHFDGATEGMSVLFNSAGLLDMRSFEEADCEKISSNSVGAIGSGAAEPAKAPLSPQVAAQKRKVSAPIDCRGAAEKTMLRVPPRVCGRLYA